MTIYFDRRTGSAVLNGRGLNNIQWTALQTPRMAPESSTWMEEARGTFGRPGMSIMLPEMTATPATSPRGGSGGSFRKSAAEGKRICGGSWENTEAVKKSSK